MIKAPQVGRLIKKYVDRFPKFKLETAYQPITPSVLQIDLLVTPDFTWDSSQHNRSEAFWILVEDCDQEEILHSEMFLVKEHEA